MPQTALITYHSAYNFGSALQALATQTAMERLGHPVEIIDYRMVEQNYFYQKLYRTKYGLKVAVKDLMMAPVQAKRKERMRRYEQFFAEYFRLSRRVAEPSEVAELWSQYDLAVSGSDQIWNKRSNELKYNDWEHMGPYLLKGFQGRKVSYASSFGSMKDDGIEKILPDIRGFDAIAMRESASADKLKSMLGRPVPVVLDPTFLLSREEWMEKLKLSPRKDGERMILCYSLGGPGTISKYIKALRPIAKRRHCKVDLVTPFAYVPCFDSRIEQHYEYGPREFLQALSDAEMVITDSYHGTVLSVNFGTEFYSICKPGGAEFRKTDILDRLGLRERIITDAAAIPELDFTPVDHATVYDKLNTFRQQSVNYLKEALGRRE